jgi:hypothetical protein
MDAAIVERQATEVSSQFVHLRTPAIAMNTGALDQQDRRAVATHVVDQAATTMFKGE